MFNGDNCKPNNFCSSAILDDHKRTSSVRIKQLTKPLNKMILVILVSLSIFGLFLFLKNSKRFNKLWIEKRDDAKASMPAVWSNIEDVLLSWNDKICENILPINKPQSTKHNAKNNVDRG